MNGPLVVDFDRQIFERQGRGGVSRYFADLISALAANPALGVDPRIAIRATTNAHVRRPGGRALRVPDRRVTRAAVGWINGSARTEGADLVHHTYYDEAWLERLPSSVRVTTVHDMIPESMPEHFPGGNPHRGKDAYLEASQLVIAVSETTRTELLRLRPRLAAPIVVVPEAAAPIFRPHPETRLPDGPQTLLYVGRRDAYKQFDVLVRAVGELRRAFPRIRIACAGGGALTQREASTIAALGLESIVRQADVSDARLARLYREAVALVATSAAEGFGLPVVEAMQSGCPVVLPEASCFPEVAGEAGLYYAPGGQHELAESLATLLASRELVEERRSAGLARARAFSWGRTAELTATAYHSVAADARPLTADRGIRT